MEERLFNDQELISRFIRHFLMQTGEIIRPGEVFEAIRERYLHSSTDQIRQLLQDLNRYSDYYRRIWYPEEEIPEDPIFRMIIRSLIRIRLLGPDQICPFLMLCLADNDPASDSGNRLSDEDLCRVLRTCESYLVRRAVCNRSDSGYTQVFSDLCRESRDGGPDPGRVASFFTAFGNRMHALTMTNLMIISGIQIFTSPEGITSLSGLSSSLLRNSLMTVTPV
jgi:hypothetical protein